MNNKQQKKAALYAHLITLVALFTATSLSFAAQSPHATQNKTPALSPATKAVYAGAAVDAATSLSPNTAIDDAPLVPPAPVTQDPYEGFNRAMFSFNEKVDQYFVRPVATFYNTIMPKPLNQGIHNFFNNIGELPTIANDILQLNFYQTMNDVWRLGINSTIGILGFFDVASHMGLDYYANDFGLTLARYGWKNSNYLVLPLFGPSTIRDTVEIPVDYNFFSIYPYVEPQSHRYILYGVGVVDRRAQLLQYQTVFEEAAVDKYIFMRNAYMQRRAHQIEQNAHLSYADQEAAKRDKGKGVEVTPEEVAADTTPASGKNQ